MWQEGVMYRTEGHQFQQQGNLEQAAAAYRKAIIVKPDYAEAYNDLGVILESMGDAAGAEDAYKTSLKFKPDLGSAHSNLALLYEETNRVKEAAVHWGARSQIGPLDDPWVIKAREKLAKYNLRIPETEAEKAEKRAKEIRVVIETGKADLEAKQYDKAISEFERALKIDPTNADATRLLRSAKVQIQKEQARQDRESGAAKGSRIKSEVEESKRKEAARKAEAEREWFQQEQAKGAQREKIQQASRQMKELEEARRKAAAAEQKAQEAESEKMVEAAKRIEAEKRVEEIEKKATVEERVREKEKAVRQVEEAKKRAAEATQRAEIAHKAAEAARMAAAAADQTYQAARQTVEAAKETEAMVKQTEVTHQEAAQVPVKAAVPPPVATEQISATAPSEAQAIARQIITEKSKLRGQTAQELSRRAAVAMREDRYQDAVDTYKQMLMLDPGNRSAKQGLERAQKALAKEAR